MIKLACLVLVVAGCAKTDSGDLLTTGIYADIAARSQGMGSTSVYATLYVGNPLNLNFVQLTGEDHLVASNGGHDEEMAESQLLNLVGHVATFATDGEGQEFNVDFQRMVDAGAPSSVAVLPAKFTLTALAQTSSRATALPLRWSPSGSAEAMSWSAEGECIDRTGGAIPGDTGSFDVPANTLTKRQGTGVADMCSVTVVVERRRPGTLDPHYGKGGNVAGIQQRSSTFASAP